MTNYKMTDDKFEALVGRLGQAPFFVTLLAKVGTMFSEHGASETRRYLGACRSKL
jgi:hypothetical protein